MSSNNTPLNNHLLKLAGNVLNKRNKRNGKRRRRYNKLNVSISNATTKNPPIASSDPTVAGPSNRPETNNLLTDSVDENLESSDTAADLQRKLVIPSTSLKPSQPSNQATSLIVHSELKENIMEDKEEKGDSPRTPPGHSISPPVELIIKRSSLNFIKTLDTSITKGESKNEGNKEDETLNNSPHTNTPPLTINKPSSQDNLPTGNYYNLLHSLITSR
ncbi:uncharacterized protein [Prorops nasuta]|uniref:uncharacterized protein n=1 Tax=Prorops nasuta TaxID=863751 RepID=UPI0034CEC5E5